MTEEQFKKAKSLIDNHVKYGKEWRDFCFESQVESYAVQQLRNKYPWPDTVTDEELISAYKNSVWYATVRLRFAFKRLIRSMGFK